MDAWASVLAGFHGLCWATYVGGALVMEFVWRPAQQDLPGAQTAVACQRMGLRYRWIALASLLGVAVSGVGLLFEAGHLATSAPVVRESLSLSAGYGRTMAALGVVWVALMANLALLTFIAHPGLHVRMTTDLTESEMRRAREKVGRAIRRMDRVLRFDLGLALLAMLLGASLPSGGLL